MSTLKERMEELAAATGWDTGQIAEVAGVSSSAVSQWFGKGSKIINSIGIAPATRLEQASGFRAMWLSKGELPKMVAIEKRQNFEYLSLADEINSIQQDDEPSNRVDRIKQAELRWSILGKDTGKKPRATLTPILSWEYEDDLPEGDYVFIPRLDIKLSAGNGSEQVEFDFIKRQPQAFRADWIRLKKLAPNKLAAMKVDGESMEPFIWDGETVIVDVSQNTVKDGKVYALWYDGGERVKRLYRLPGGCLRIDSDNPKHASIEVGADQLADVRIIGRVVHKQGDGGL